MSEKLNALFKSRRFWVAIAGIATVVLKDQFQLPVTEEQIQYVVLLAGAWIVGDSLRATESPKL